MPKQISFSERLKSFKYALNGLKYLYTFEHNFRIHLSAAIITVITGIILHLTFIEWSVILIVISIVLITEIVNSSIENLSDFVSTEYSETIKHVKDFAAAAVLIATVASIIIGIMIFLPKLLLLVF